MTAGVHHFFVAPNDIVDGVVTITGDEAHHAARVLRVREGEQISAADGSGRVVQACVSEVGDVVRAVAVQERSVPVLVPEIVLVQAVAKGDRMDDAVSKAVELGVARIVPFLAERSVVRWDVSRARKAGERWKALGLAAAKQSRSARLTSIDDVAAGLPAIDVTTTIALHEGASDKLRDVLPTTPPDTLALVVGPEGGLTPGEVDGLRSTGAAVASLGDRILRTETAGVVAAAIVAYAYGSLG